MEQYMLKLYVWDEDFLTDWTSGVAFVIADSLKEARQILRKKMGRTYSGYSQQETESDIMQKPKVLKLTKRALYYWGGS